MTARPPSAPVDVLAWLAASQASGERPLMNHDTLWDNGFLVRMYDGPTTPGRSDFHINQVPELFLQFAGELRLRVLAGTEFVDHVIGPGELYSLPAGVPHRNRRARGSVGLVVHVTRTPDQTDAIVWYCDRCADAGRVAQLHRVEYRVTELRENLRGYIRAFLRDESGRTCDACGWVMPPQQGAM